MNPSLMALVLAPDGTRRLSKLRDLSLTGCFLEGMQDTGASLFSLELPLEDTTIMARARVARVERRQDGLLDLALAFQDLSWESICAIARHLAPRL